MLTSLLPASRSSSSNIRIFNPSLYLSASQDEIHQVRKVAAITLSEMIKLIPKIPEQELLNIFANFFKDDQDSVKMQGIDSCVAFCKHLSPAVLML